MEPISGKIPLATVIWEKRWLKQCKAGSSESHNSEESVPRSFIWDEARSLVLRYIKKKKIRGAADYIELLLVMPPSLVFWTN